MLDDVERGFLPEDQGYRDSYTYDMDVRNEDNICWSEERQLVDELIDENKYWNAMRKGETRERSRGRLGFRQL